MAILSIYGCESDIRAAREFLFARYDHGESILFVALEDNTLVGFTQAFLRYLLPERLYSTIFSFMSTHTDMERHQKLIILGRNNCHRIVNDKRPAHFTR